MADPGQPREVFSEEGLEQLARSLEEKGQLSPIRVRWSDEQNKWIIIAGERRYRATLRAGLPTIECYFHEGDMTHSEILEQQLIENCLREDLLPIEEARAFEQLRQLNGWTQKELAQALRVSASRVTRVLALLKLAPDVQNKVDAGEISARAGYELSKLPRGDIQRRLADEVPRGNTSSERMASKVRQRRGREKPKPRGTRLTFAADGGWKVVISAARKGSYEEVEEALAMVLEEVRHRVHNRVQIF